MSVDDMPLARTVVRLDRPALAPELQATRQAVTVLASRPDDFLPTPNAPRLSPVLPDVIPGAELMTVVRSRG